MLRLSRRIRQSEFIQRKQASNLHHAVRIAAAIGFPLNLSVTVNFAHTSCPPDGAAIAFQKARQAFGKWVTRPRKQHSQYRAPPTFIWVFENPTELNAHWLVHVPHRRQAEFRELVPLWFHEAGAEMLDSVALHFKAADTPTGACYYMLKGTHPAVAPFYGVRHAHQGWVRGQRAGTSRNLGPAEKRRLREAGRYRKTIRRSFTSIALSTPS